MSAEDMDELWKKAKRKMQREIRAARKKGLAWTKPRPFLNWTEKVGKMKCSPSPRPKKCTRRATHVSYSTMIAGCVALCDHCAEERT